MLWAAFRDIPDQKISENLSVFSFPLFERLLRRRIGGKQTAVFKDDLLEISRLIC